MFEFAGNVSIEPAAFQSMMVARVRLCLRVLMTTRRTTDLTRWQCFISLYVAFLGQASCRDWAVGFLREAMAPKPAPSAAPWVQHVAQRLETYHDILEEEGGYPSGEPAASRGDQGKGKHKGKHWQVKKRPAREVPKEGGREPQREWPNKPSKEMEALRYGFPAAATFSPGRHALLVRGRPCVVPSVMVFVLGWLVCFDRVDVLPNPEHIRLTFGEPAASDVPCVSCCWTCQPGYVQLLNGVGVCTRAVA